MTVSAWVALVILLGVYIAIALDFVHRTLAAFLGAAAVLLITCVLGTFHPSLSLLPWEDAVKAVDLNVILLLWAMMIIVGVMKRTGVFQWMAYKSFQAAGGNIFLLAGVLMVVTAVTSAFLDNVTTMLLLIPVTIEIAATLKLNPLALLMPEVFASNVGGTATLIGDPPNILIGSYAHLDFNAFVANLTPIVAICLVFCVAWMLWWFRKDLAAARVENVPGLLAQLRAEYRITDPKLLAYSLFILGLTIALFVTHGFFHMAPAIPALAGAALLLLLGGVHIVEIMEKEIEWPTLMFFMMLFIVVGAAEHTGLIQVVARQVQTLSGGQLWLAVVLVLWVSAIASAVVDNIPFTATMLPIVAYLTTAIPGAQGGILWWALSLGACLGGNGTLIGASANVVTVGLAEKAGHKITFMYYLKVAALPMLITIGLCTAWLLGVEMPKAR